MKKCHVLVVDDDLDVLHTAKMILKREYTTVDVESSPIRLESLLKKDEIDIIILDMNFKTGATSGNEGLFWLKKIKQVNPNSYVIMNTAYGDIRLAVESMKLGAVDFLVKPWEKEKLLATVNTVYQLFEAGKKVQKLEDRDTMIQQDIDHDFGTLISQSKAMKPVMEMIHKVAETDASVLILGENGTGKELVAREIHRKSPRNHESMIKVDLGALPESLFESELFGHVKGAYTDAKEDRAGRFEVADNGTLFLDEIGNLKPMMQVKLLSVLQNRVFSRVGSNKPISFDVRLISATNQPLYKQISENQFRQDLLYRINTMEIELPPLRNRKEDIPLLVNHFLKIYSDKYNKPGLVVKSKTMKQLNSYPWPGNIRELRHAIERAVIMSDDKEINAHHLLPTKNDSSQKSSLKVQDVERGTIEKAIEKHNGNMSQAADELGIGRTTLYRKMKKYGI